MYPCYQKDRLGELLDGRKNNYSITFSKDDIPKSDLFRSFTMYDLLHRFLVKNSINRYSISSQTKTFKKDKDVSISIYFQSKSLRNSRKGNWWPTPAGYFYNILHIYGPNKSVLNDTYKLQ